MTDDVVCHKRDGAEVVNWKLCLHSLDALAELGERAAELLAARRRRHREACLAWQKKNRLADSQPAGARPGAAAEEGQPSGAGKDDPR